jgi:hypothetical protein
MPAASRAKSLHAKENVMKKWTIATLVGLLIIGCVGFGGKDPGSLASGLSLSKSQYAHSSESVSAYIGENFPNLRVSLSLNYETDFEDKEIAKAFSQATYRQRHWLILYLSDRKVSDFQGSGNLAKMANDIHRGLAEITFENPSHRAQFKAVYFSNISFSEEKNLMPMQIQSP